MLRRRDRRGAGTSSTRRSVPCSAILEGARAGLPATAATSTCSRTRSSAPSVDFERRGPSPDARPGCPSRPPWRAQPRVHAGSSPGTWSVRFATWTGRASCSRRSAPVSAAIGEQDRAEVLMAAGLDDRGPRGARGRRPGLRVAPPASASGRGRARPGPSLVLDDDPARRAGLRAARPRALPRGGRRRVARCAPRRSRWRRRWSSAGPARACSRRRAAGRRARRARVCAWAAAHGAAARRRGSGCGVASSTRRATTLPGSASVRGRRSPSGCSTATSGPSWRQREGRRADALQAPAGRAERPARLAELVRQPRPADQRGRPGAAARRPRAGAGRRLAQARGALRVVGAGADAGQPGPAGARAAGRVDGRRPGRAPRDRAGARGRPACRPRARGRAAAAGPGARLAAPRAPARSTTRSSLGELQDGARRRHRPGRVRRDRQPGDRARRHRRRRHPARPGRARAAGRACSTGCCPTSTWRPPTCRTRWPRSVRRELGRAARPAGADCWSRRCSTRSATGGWCSRRPGVLAGGAVDPAGRASSAGR